MRLLLLLAALWWGIVAAGVLLTHGPSLRTLLMIVASGACAAISAPGLFSAMAPRDTEPPPATSQGALLAYLLVGWIGWSNIPLFALHLTSDIVLGRLLTAIVLDGSVFTGRGATLHLNGDEPCRGSCAEAKGGVSRVIAGEDDIHRTSATIPGPGGGISCGGRGRHGDLCPTERPG